MTCSKLSSAREHFPCRAETRPAAGPQPEASPGCRGQRRWSRLRVQAVRPSPARQSARRRDAATAGCAAAKRQAGLADARGPVSVISRLDAISRRQIQSTSSRRPINSTGNWGSVPWPCAGAADETSSAAGPPASSKSRAARLGSFSAAARRRSAGTRRPDRAALAASSVLIKETLAGGSAQVALGQTGALAQKAEKIAKGGGRRRRHWSPAGGWRLRVTTVWPAKPARPGCVPGPAPTPASSRPAGSACATWAREGRVFGEVARREEWWHALIRTMAAEQPGCILCVAERQGSGAQPRQAAPDHAYVLQRHALAQAGQVTRSRSVAGRASVDRLGQVVSRQHDTPRMPSSFRRANASA